MINNIFSKFTSSTPGYAIVVSANDRIVFEKYEGLADVARGISITANPQFRLASISKPFTAQAIDILKEKNKLKLSDPVKRFFPRFAQFGKDITIDQLITHRSGLPDHELVLNKQKNQSYEPTIRDAYNVFQKMEKTNFPVGSKYEYSDAGYVLLALIIEKVSGMPYRDFLSRDIFKPYGLSHTLVVDETKPSIKNRAYGYKKIGKTYELYDYDRLNYIVGCEGIYSTARDLARWVSSTVLKSKNTIGWFVEGDIVFHRGTWVGFNNIVVMNVKKETSAILLSNTTAFPNKQTRLNLGKGLLDLTNCSIEPV